MVDFSKKIGIKGNEKKINPIEIYETLDRESDKGPLRPAQKAVLEKWYRAYSTNRDVIIKLHTGQGKTLIGLLILQSRINNNLAPALYLCINNFLVKQTCEQAKQFGIKYCIIDEENNLPFEFLNGDQILITTAQKLFNGLTIFGLDNQSEEVNSIVLDDSHACIDNIRDSFTIKIYRNCPLYLQIIQLFEGELSYQGVGTLSEIKSNEYDALLPVPYWAWFDKYVEVSDMLAKHKDENTDIKFGWELLKDNIRECQCIISGTLIEIKPYYNPIHKYGSFYNAKQRVLMSATTVDDSFFLNGLSLSAEAVRNPLIYDDERWSGEKMILIPSLIDQRLDRTEIINRVAPTKKSRTVGSIALVPGFHKANVWEECGAELIKNDAINQRLREFKKGDFANLIVLINRYDGIDLADDECRILYLDSKPVAFSLDDQYQETCRQNSEIILIKTSQKIEQGLGRSVRGEKDYSVIIILGAELVNLLRGQKTRKYFSSQTKRQIDIGLEITKMAKEEVQTDDIEESIKVMNSLIRQLLIRDEGWKNYYNKQMELVEMEEKDYDILPILELEKDAESLFYKSKFKEASSVYQTLIDRYCNDNQERGWYLQNMARCIYIQSIAESIKFQNSAFKYNHYLLKPLDIEYEKLTPLTRNRVTTIKKAISSFDSFEYLILKIAEIAANLEFGVKAEKFECALNELGQFLGFKTERPDKEWKEGPDNLWCFNDNQYVFFECKSEVDIRRDEIAKAETGQMNNSIAWFEKNYSTDNVTRILIFPSKKLSKATGFNKEVRIMRKNKLSQLIHNFKHFYNEFKHLDFNDLDEDFIQRLIALHSLDIESLKVYYSELPISS